MEVSSEKLACVIARAIDDKLGKNISILNISIMPENFKFFFPGRCEYDKCKEEM